MPNYNFKHFHARVCAKKKTKYVLFNLLKLFIEKMWNCEIEFPSECITSVGTIAGYLAWNLIVQNWKCKTNKVLWDENLRSKKPIKGCIIKTTRPRSLRVQAP